MAQKEYNRRYNNVARIVHLKLCGKCNLKRSEKWHEYSPEIVENEEVKILWDVMIQSDRDQGKKMGGGKLDKGKKKWQMGRGREIVVKTEQVRKNVNV